MDCFKEVNDRFGHAAGDRALKAIAEILLNGRSMDIAARYGGDEFVILMPNTGWKALRWSRELRRAASAVVFPDIPNTASASASAWQIVPPGEGILERADAQMYACKRGGTNAPFSIHEQNADPMKWSWRASAAY